MHIETCHSKTKDAADSFRGGKPAAAAKDSGAPPADGAIPGAPARRLWADAARTAAALAVVVVHASGRLVVDPAAFGSAGWWAAILYNAGGRWCIGVFLMVSGALLLDARAPDAPAWVFLRRRARRILLPLVVWTLFYLGYQHVRNGLDLPHALRLVGQGAPYYHLWYLFMLPWLYALTPFLRALLRRLGGRRAALLAGGLVAAGMAHAAAATFWRLPAPPPLLTLWMPYLGLYLCGYWLAGPPAPRIAAWARRAPVLAPLCVLFSAAASYALHGVELGGAPGAWLFFLKLLSPPIVGATFLAAWWLRVEAPRRLPAGAARVLGRLAPLTLGVYALHPLALRELARLGVRLEMLPAVLSIPLVAAIAAALCFAAAALLARAPVLREAVS